LICQQSPSSVRLRQQHPASPGDNDTQRH